MPHCLARPELALAAPRRVCFPINSSAISVLCYDLEQTLTITFTDGASYDIPNFPVLELARWLAASSKDAYFNLNVRDRY